MRNLTEIAEVAGYPVPILKPHAELAAIMFHNVFPEKTFTIESYYLVKCYLDLMEERGTLDAFVDVCRTQKVEYACAVNLALARDIDKAQFGIEDSRIDRILRALRHPGLQISDFDPLGSFPYDLPARAFWRSFISKQRDRTSFVSTLNQGAHMLSPVFFADVIRIIWRRTVKGGVYEQN